ncbi:MAG: MYG1 family protein [Parachlamydiales bacterium]|nr:MYG1 family protein [Parachlamydiales bacterium]
MEEKIIVRSVGTHDGPFHADEVCACALLWKYRLIECDKIFRTRDKKILSHCEFLCDIGNIYDPSRKRFDHHQIDYKGNKSSAGMILSYLRDQKIISGSLYDYFNRSLIKSVDAYDVGEVDLQEESCTFSDVIANFLPIEYEAAADVEKAAFFSALDFTYAHLERLEKRFYYLEKCKETVRDVMAVSNRLLVFDKAIPWEEAFFSLDGDRHPAEFLIMPSGIHWKLRTIPPSFAKRMQMRRSLPLEWGGLREEDLRNASGIPGAIFCHKNLFISIWETKEDALKAYKYVMRKNGYSL